MACRSTWHRRKAVDRKEFFESTEFFARSRHKLRADGGGTLVDVAGGHGLGGVLAAIFMAERFERVIVRDMRRPAAFDEVLGYAETFSGQPGMTGTLQVRYRSPTPLHEEVIFTAQLDRVDGRKIFCSSTLHADERLCAEATAIFVSSRPGTFARLLAARKP